MKDKVLSGFGIEYNTATEMCCENKAIIEDRLLVGFE